MKNKKGFTLVELVIVIAVIAILAGVMIGTFASVVKKAKESAKMQEMAAQKTEQTANDVLEKLKNQNWLGWEDFETKLAEAVSKTVGTGTWDKDQKENMVAAMKEAVDKALAEYAANLGKDNTALTAEHVKYIVETALANKSYSGVTEAQVKAIVNSATSGLSNLNKSQVQAIVDSAANLTVSEVAAAINRASTTNKTNLDDAVTAIKTELGKIKGEIKDSALTAEDIEAIVSRYVTANGEAKGDFSWYTKDAKDYTIDSADQLVALATVANGGVDNFANKTITLKKDATIELTEDWVNVKSFAGTLNGNGATVKGVSYDVIYFSTEKVAANGTSAKVGFNSAGDYYGSKSCYGFINELVAGATLENVTIEYDIKAGDICADPMSKYTYFGGAVGVMRKGSTLKNVTVTGTVHTWGRSGALVGFAEKAMAESKKVAIDGCKVVSFELHSRNTGAEKENSPVSGKASVELYGSASGMVGFVEGAKIIVQNTTLENVKLFSENSKGEQKNYKVNEDSGECSADRTAIFTNSFGGDSEFTNCTYKNVTTFNDAEVSVIIGRSTVTSVRGLTKAN